MTEMLARLVTDDRGQDLAEYGIALAVIGTLWSRAQNMIDSAAS